MARIIKALKKRSGSGGAVAPTKKRTSIIPAAKKRRNWGDERNQHKVDKNLKKEKKKQDRRENGWFARWQKGRTERAAIKAEGKVNKAAAKGANGKSFGDVVGDIAGIAANIIRPNGNVEQIESTGSGFVNKTTGSNYDPQENDTVIVNDKLKTAMSEKGVKVEKLSYTDADLDFIDDVTGKYIWAKESHENILEYIWRLITHKNSPMLARVAGVVGTVAVVFALVKWALMPLWKMAKKKFRF